MGRTARLDLEPVGEGDVASLHALFVHPEIRRYLWDDEIVDLVVAQAIAVRSAELFRVEGAGLWAVRRIGEPEMIGFAGYWYFFDPPKRQILFGLHPGHWGRGYGLELVRELLRAGFEDLGLEEIEGSTDEPNVASQKVMEKAGMHLASRREGPKWPNLTYLARK